MSAEGAAALDFCAGLDLSRKSLVASTSIARERYPEHFAALLDLVQGRAKAAAKLRPAPGAGDWLATAEAVEQATAWPVAQRRATRLAAHTVHDLTCSVGAELAELVRQCPLVIGSDLDPARAMMAAHNVPGAHVLRADALHPASRDAVYLADPARRAGGRRIVDPAHLLPPLPALLDALAGADYAVKCAPGLDFDALEHDGEVEVASLDGGVREACLWSAGLSDGVRRRATVLRTAPGASPAGGASTSGEDTVWAEEVTDRDPEIDAPDGGADGESDRYIVDPDGAIVRAGLVRHWAARHGLRQLDPRIAHLTGDAIPAGYSGFEVLDRCRLDVKDLRRRLRALDAGSLEILVRGVDTDPDVLRRKLAPKGTRPLALVVSRVGSNAVVFVCGPRTSSGNGPDQFDNR